jgi:hypothetical protein
MLVYVRPSNQATDKSPQARSFLSKREWPRLPFTARIERAQFHRARSASKRGTWSLPSHPSQGARSGST